MLNGLFSPPVFCDTFQQISLDIQAAERFVFIELHYLIDSYD